MNSINNTIAGLELAQIGWVVPDIHVAVKFLVNALRIAGFPQPEQIRAQDLGMTYYGQVVAGEWLTTQTYNGGTFIELVQPVSGESMFHDYLAQYPAGGTQHLAFRLPVADFERVTSDLCERLCDHQRSEPPNCPYGFLRHLPNAGRCHRDYGHHAGRMDRH